MLTNNGKVYDALIDLAAQEIVFNMKQQATSFVLNNSKSLIFFPPLSNSMVHFFQFTLLVNRCKLKI